jgi:hypothetical protein
MLVVNMDMCGETGFLSNNKTTYIDIDDGSTGVQPINNEQSKIFGEKWSKMPKIIQN